jgi:hypothetical protein
MFPLPCAPARGRGPGGEGLHPGFLTILLQTSVADVWSDNNYRDVMNLKSALWAGEIRWRQEAQSAVMVLVVIQLEISAQFS